MTTHRVDVAHQYRDAPNDEREGAARGVKRGGVNPGAHEFAQRGAAEPTSHRAEVHRQRQQRVPLRAALRGFGIRLAQAIALSIQAHDLAPQGVHARLGLALANRVRLDRRNDALLPSGGGVDLARHVLHRSRL